VILTAENYYSKEMNMAYMGSTQYKDFMSCEAAALAKIHGEYSEEMSAALLVGSYVDAYFEGTLNIFKAKHPELFTLKGELKADYKQAEYIIRRIERDTLFYEWAMSGEKQIIKTGEIAGVPFKIKIDSYHPSEAIVDLKIMKDFAPVWVDGKGKVSFVEAWGYDIQAAIYQEIEGNGLPFIIAAATKEKPEPDISVMRIPDEILGYALDEVKRMAPIFHQLKQGVGTPRRCEMCDYCKSTKVLSEVVDYRKVR